MISFEGPKPPWLSYSWNGYRFEFGNEELLITNERYLPQFKRFKLKFTGNDNDPFIIILDEEGFRK